MFDYICTDCRYEFEDDSSEYDKYKNCPCCGGTVERMYFCEECKKPLPASLYKYHRCQNCKDKTLQKFRRFLRGLTISEMHYLEDYTDGRWWADILNGKNTICNISIPEPPTSGCLPVATATVQRISDFQKRLKKL